MNQILLAEFFRLIQISVSQRHQFAFRNGDEIGVVAVFLCGEFHAILLTVSLSVGNHIVVAHIVDATLLLNLKRVNLNQTLWRKPVVGPRENQLQILLVAVVAQRHRRFRARNLVIQALVALAK